MARKSLPVLLLLGVLISLTGSLVFAQRTTADVSLSASVRSDGKVLLNWTKPPGDSLRYYLVYRSSLPTALSFTKIDSTTTNEFVDSPAANSIPPVYTYYVEARMNKGATLKSNTVTVMLTVPRVDVVRILSEPVKSGRVGLVYTYLVKASSSDSTAKLKFELVLKPAGMTIDSTGLIKWTPTAKGNFTVQVNAISNKGGRASQLFYVEVTGPSGTITGAVVDSTTGKPLGRVIVRLYGQDVNNHFEFDATTDSLGKYTITKIDFGTYVARAEPMKGDYLAQWYDGATTLDKAKPIPVKDSVVVQVNFKLKAKAVIPIFTVSGTVLDSLKKPVKNASVSFTVSSFGLNSAKSDGSDWSSDNDDRDLFDQGQSLSLAIGASSVIGGMGAPSMGVSISDIGDFRLDGNSAYVFTAKVDSTGKYSIKLPQGSYIGQASAPGYYRLFYNNRSDLLSADIIKVQADVPNINFVLRPVLPLALGTISGSVVDSVSRGGVISRVMAFRSLPTGKDTILAPRSYMADTDSLGAYTLVNLPPGDYIVMAVPLGHFVPSFYSVLGSTRSWKSATKINVNGNTVAGITIYVVPMTRALTGYAAIKGSVNSSTPTTPGAMGKTSSVAGIEGSMVYATDNATGEVAGYGVTGSDGSFAIGELAPSTYTVTVDKLDYSSTSTTASPTYDGTTGAAQNPTVSMNIDASVATDIAGPGAAVPASDALEQNYPNPFNPTTQIAFSLPQSERVSLTIYNLLGQKVATLFDGLLAQGTHIATWNGRDAAGLQLPSGVYFYTLKSANFAVSRKMMMLK